MFQPPSVRDSYMDAIATGDIPEDYDYLQFGADEATDALAAAGDLARKARLEDGDG